MPSQVRAFLKFDQDGIPVSDSKQRGSTTILLMEFPRLICELSAVTYLYVIAF